MTPNLTFIAYSLASGKVVNCAKSFIYGSEMSLSIRNILIELMGFSNGSTPFNYLGVPIFKGRPHVIFLHPIADKIICKLSS